jgi:predicted DsbA family dithiol-disulfide isomerase
MKIEIWSDLTCPFCYIGKHNFERALKQLEHTVTIQVQWRSFELDPRASKDYPGTLYDWLSKRYGRTHEEVIEMNRPIIQQGASLGLKFNLDKVRPTNSFDAHRLMQLASRRDSATALAEKLYEAFFTDGKNISDHSVLKEAAISCNLPEKDVTEVLTTDEFSMDVREDEYEAQRLSIRGVPYFLFDRKVFISGAQPTDVFLRILTERQ